MKRYYIVDLFAFLYDYASLALRWLLADLNLFALYFIFPLGLFLKIYMLSVEES